MSKQAAGKLELSTLPSVDSLLNLALDIELPHQMKKNEARAILSAYRSRISTGKSSELKTLEQEYILRLHKISNSLRRVINGTGIVIHTNLGRSPLSKELIHSLSLLEDAYINLELDLEKGKRGSRHDHLRPWIQSLTLAEDGILVNNNAAAVLLSLNSLADKKEVIISRGQLVEIGGSFRIPEILKKAGSKLVEVGTTNRTHLSDYETAITPRTKLLLWVHSSNYKITGFTKAVSLADLVGLGKKHDLPVMADLGSGALISIDSYGLAREPLVPEIIEAGVDIVTFSVDKLLGGPQGGIIAGKQKYIQKIEKNHLLRALRPDKSQILFTLQSLKAFSRDKRILEHIPIYRDLSQDIKSLRKRAKAIIEKMVNPRLTLEIIDTQAQVGSGASPSETMESVGISLKHKKFKANRISTSMRAFEPAIMGRISDEIYLIDLKAIRESEDIFIIKALNTLS